MDFNSRSLSGDIQILGHQLHDDMCPFPGCGKTFWDSYNLSTHYRCHVSFTLITFRQEHDHTSVRSAKDLFEQKVSVPLTRSSTPTIGPTCVLMKNVGRDLPELVGLTYIWGFMQVHFCSSYRLASDHLSVPSLAATELTRKRLTLTFIWRVIRASSTLLQMWKKIIWKDGVINSKLINSRDYIILKMKLKFGVEDPSYLAR
jgi:hypothetical protein